MFCNKCGAQNADGTKFCQSCGNPMTAARPRNVKNNAPLGQFAPSIRPYWPLTLAIIAILAFVLFILNTFCILDVPTTAKSDGVTDTSYLHFSDAADGWKAYDKSFACAYIGNILFGITNLVIAAVGMLYFLKKCMRMPYYDQFVAKYIKVKNPAFYIGIAGVGTALLQVIFFAFCGFSSKLSLGGLGSFSLSMSVGVPWLTWVALGIYAVIGAMGYLVFENKD